MNRWEIILGIAFGLLVNEITDISPWLAKKLVRWSAYRWTTDAELAEAYAEEWAALIEERPGKLFKLLTAFRFAMSAIIRSTGQRFASLLQVARQLATRLSTQGRARRSRDTEPVLLVDRLIEMGLDRKTAQEMADIAVDVEDKRRRLYHANLSADCHQDQ